MKKFIFILVLLLIASVFGLEPRAWFDTASERAGLISGWVTGMIEGMEEQPDDEIFTTFNDGLGVDGGADGVDEASVPVEAVATRTPQGSTATPPRRRVNQSSRIDIPTFRAAVLGVIDGDTIEVRDLKTREVLTVRVTPLDAPEAGQPYYDRSTQQLRRKLDNQTIVIEDRGLDSEDRIVGKVYLGDRDISQEMIAEGFAWIFDPYLQDDRLLTDLHSAREWQLGIWSVGATPPWDWREGRETGPVAEFTDTCGSKRYCYEMGSCAEARYYARSCGLTNLDTDGDGVPCEGVCPQ
ncbi:MAG: thermonuclease family protein [Pseudomonadota bacterium]